jgi:putative ABC transport system ATP-binding protein
MKPESAGIVKWFHPMLRFALPEPPLLVGWSAAVRPLQKAEPMLKRTLSPRSPGPSIRVEALAAVYGKGPASVHALRRIDLIVPSGQVLCVIGPSGSGKSTLLHLLAGLQRPTSGTIRIGDVDIHELSLDDAARWRRRNVGMVHQFFNLVPTLTIVQNIAAPLLFEGYRLSQVRDRIDELLERLGILDRRDHGLDELSGGEMQRVAIARALIAEPGLLLADEPTGNLDSVTSGEIFALFQELIKERGGTLVMMTHDLLATSYADRVIVLRDGRIAEDSEPTVVN